MLGLENSLKWTVRDDGLEIVLPSLSLEERPCEHAYVLKLTHIGTSTLPRN
jgi:hypothetical protein